MIKILVFVTAYALLVKTICFILEEFYELSLA